MSLACRYLSLNFPGSLRFPSLGRREPFAIHSRNGARPSLRPATTNVSPSTTAMTDLQNHRAPRPDAGRRRCQHRRDGPGRGTVRRRVRRRGQGAEGNRPDDVLDPRAGLDARAQARRPAKPVAAAPGTRAAAGRRRTRTREGRAAATPAQAVRVDAANTAPSPVVVAAPPAAAAPSLAAAAGGRQRQRDDHAAARRRRGVGRRRRRPRRPVHRRAADRLAGRRGRA